MGKRKIHNTTFYQCDWTGYAMRAPYCYLPQWTSAGKLIKKGSYCNWESVVAHADALHEAGNPAFTEEDVRRIREYVLHLVGTPVSPAPHWQELAHMKGTLDAAAFHAACCRRGALTCVLLKPDGSVTEAAIDETCLPSEHFTFAGQHTS